MQLDVFFYLRAVNRATLDEVYEKVENIVKGAALATGTTYEFGLFQNSVDDVIVTPSFDELFFAHTQEVGVPQAEIDVETKASLGSSDVGNVSQVIPTIQPTVSFRMNTLLVTPRNLKRLLEVPKD